MRRLVAGMLKAARKAVKDVHAVDPSSDGIRDEEERLVCGILEKIGTMAMRVSPAEKLYLPVRKECYLEYMTSGLRVG